jgi:hypothetical protein
MTAAVRTLRADGSTLYVGGYFDQAGPLVSSRFTIWDPSASNAPDGQEVDREVDP